MVSTPEELAIDLSRASLEAQERTEDQLREKATTVLSAASVVVPIAALGVGRGRAGGGDPTGRSRRCLLPLRARLRFRAFSTGCIRGPAGQRATRSSQLRWGRTASDASGRSPVSRPELPS